MRMFAFYTMLSSGTSTRYCCEINISVICSIGRKSECFWSAWRCASIQQSTENTSIWRDIGMVSRSNREEIRWISDAEIGCFFIIDTATRSRPYLMQQENIRTYINGRGTGYGNKKHSQVVAAQGFANTGCLVIGIGFFMTAMLFKRKWQYNNALSCHFSAVIAILPFHPHWTACPRLASCVRPCMRAPRTRTRTSDAPFSFAFSKYFFLARI